MKKLFVLIILVNPAIFCQMQWNWVSPSTPSNSYYTSTFFGDKIFLVGPASTLLVSSNSGASWNNLHSSFKPFAMYESGDLANHFISFVSDDVGYIADNQNLNKTTDGGKSWISIVSISSYDYCNIYFFDENTGWIGDYQRHRTTDGGKTWLPMNGLPESDGFILGFTAINPLQVWCFTSNYGTGSSSGIKYSSDGGNTWVNQNTGFVNSKDTSYSIVDLKMQKSGLGIAAVIESNNFVPPVKFLIRTTDFGQTWNKILVTQALCTNILPVSDSLWIIVGNDEWGVKGSAYQTSILRSTDYGLTWNDIPFSPDKFAPRTAQYLKNQNTIIAAGWYGAIYRSTDLGLTWEEISRLFPQINSLSFGNLNGTNDFGVGVGEKGFIIMTTNGGINWKSSSGNFSNNSLLSSEIIGNKVLVGTDAGTLYETIDLGKQWKKVSTPLDSIYGENIPLRITDIKFIDNSHGVIIASIGTGSNVNTPSYAFYTDDGSVSWKTIVFPLLMHAKSVSFINDSCFYIGGLYFPPSQSSGIGFIWRTTNSGKTWDTNSVPRYINTLEMTSLNFGYAGANGALIVTTDGGRTWRDGYSNANDVNAIAKETEKIIWAVSGHTLIKSTDAGVSWDISEPQIPSSEWGTALAVSSSKKMFVALNYGGFLSTIDASLTGVSEGNLSANENIIPSGFRLYQNYPNPFNPATVIEYQIQSEEFVSLKVYDILGKEITTLISEVKPAGIYRVEFNAASLPSGVYLYRISAGKHTAVKKMLLLK